ncbi:hypothetical protein WAA37_004910 [Pseudomonas aeruginosa]
MKPIIFDTETTGTDHKTDQIIEAAWLELPEFPHQFAALQPVEFPHYHERFKPNVPISLGAQAVHHIICQDLVGCRESKEFALPAGPLLMIGHNVDFDWRMAGENPDIKRICTLALSRFLFPDKDSHTQSAMMYLIARRNGREAQARELLRNAHAALDDVRNCAIVLRFLLEVAMDAGHAADTSGAIIGVKSPGQGTYSVADPRGQSFGKYPVTDWDGPSGTVIAASTTGQGAFAVADPRHSGPAKHSNEFRIVPWSRHAQAVTSAHGTGQCVEDPRVLNRTKGDSYLTGGHYGVVGFDQSAGAVSASARHDNGRWSVADPRIPAANDRLTCIIKSLDGTWHRPFTTLELAALQSLVDPEEQLILDGLSDSDWRERIGNAVPPAAAEAIAGVMGTTLLLAEAGETFMLSNTPIWVRPVAVALSVAQQEVNP